MAAVSEYCVLVLLLGAFAFGILSRAADLSTVEYATITVLPFDDGSTDQKADAKRAVVGQQATGSMDKQADAKRAVVSRQATALPAAAAAAATQVHTKLDGTLESALNSATRARDGLKFVMLTFGNAAIRDHLLNFCAHARLIGTPFVVGAVDGAAFELLAKQSTPVYKTPLALRAGYALDGANSHSSRSWKTFASMRTGEVARVVNLGFDVLHTDTDVVWLRDPTPYIMCTRDAQGPGREFAEGSKFPCAPLRMADVAVSSDNMGPGRAVHGGAAYHAAGTFNSGILLFRATERGRRFVNAWHANVASPSPRSRFWGKTSDQQVFNAMVRKDFQWPGVGGKRNEWLMRNFHPDWDGNLTLGALPLPLFANGHGYFVQSAHTRLKVSPFAVHATYSLDWHDGVAKRQRFREAGLWMVDDDAYFRGRFLALNSSSGPPPRVAAAIAKAQEQGETPYNIGVHAEALRSYIAELRDLLALARALGRIPVLPRWVCYCDKLWAGSDNILGMKCMYPGSQDHGFLPFNCPMDHVTSPHEWDQANERSGISYRDASFLLSPRLPPEVAKSIADVSVLPKQEYDALPTAKQRRALPMGMIASDAKRFLGATDDVAVLRLPHARGLLCGVATNKAETRAFNRAAEALLRAPPWCSKCERGCRKMLAKWLPPEKFGAEGRHAFRGSEWCLHTQPPPKFRAMECVLNAA